jgi:hypothetical protein
MRVNVFLNEVGAIGKDHVSQGARVLVMAVRLDRDFFASGSTGLASWGRVRRGRETGWTS